MRGKGFPFFTEELQELLNKFRHHNINILISKAINYRMSSERYQLKSVLKLSNSSTMEKK